jgi:hypothetical protein
MLTREMGFLCVPLPLLVTLSLSLSLSLTHTQTHSVREGGRGRTLARGVERLAPGGPLALAGRVQNPHLSDSVHMKDENDRIQRHFQAIGVFDPAIVDAIAAVVHLCARNHRVAPLVFVPARSPQPPAVSTHTHTHTHTHTYNERERGKVRKNQMRVGYRYRHAHRRTVTCDGMGERADVRGNTGVGAGARPSPLQDHLGAQKHVIKEEAAAHFGQARDCLLLQITVLAQQPRDSINACGRHRERERVRQRETHGHTQKG